MSDTPTTIGSRVSGGRTRINETVFNEVRKVVVPKEEIVEVRKVVVPKEEIVEVRKVVVPHDLSS